MAYEGLVAVVTGWLCSFVQENAGHAHHLSKAQVQELVKRFRHSSSARCVVAFCTRKIHADTKLRVGSQSALAFLDYQFTSLKAI